MEYKKNGIIQSPCIGIGITTYQRPEHLELCLKNIGKYTAKPFKLFIYDDSTERHGIAYGKNQCLKDLKDCDYIFLYDDDCFPIKSGWADFFIDAHKRTGQHHFLYLKETSTIKRTGQNMSINIYDNCGGCFLFLTKQIIEKVGGYGSYSNYYGMEHAGFTERIHMAGLTSMGKYLCPHDAGNFIFSLDYDYDEHYNKLVNHRPSMINEIDKIDLYIRNGMINFVEDIKQIYRSI